MATRVLRDNIDRGRHSYRLFAIAVAEIRTALTTC